MSSTVEHIQPGDSMLLPPPSCKGSVLYYVRSLRVLLVIVILLVAIISAAVAIAPLYVLAYASAEDVAIDYMAAVTRSVASSTTTYFAFEQNVVGVMEAASQNGAFTWQDHASVTQWMAFGLLLGGADYVSFIFDLPGDVWTAGFITPNNVPVEPGTFVVVRFNTTGSVISTYNLSLLNMTLINISYSTKTSGFRGNAYYPTMHARRSWGAPFVGSSLGVPQAILPCGAPIVLPNGTTVGAIYVRTISDVLSAYFASLDIATTGRVLLFDPVTRAFVASNNKLDPTFKTVNGINNITTYSDCVDPLITRSVKQLGDTLCNCTTPCTLNYGTGSETVYVSVVQVRDTFGLNKRLAVMIPSDDFLGAIRQGSQTSIGATCGAGAGLLLLAVFAVILVIRPLQDLERRLQRTRTLQGLDEVNSVFSSVSEIRSIEEAFARLQLELKKIRSFIPQSVLELVGDTTSSDDESFHILTGDDVNRSPGDEDGSLHSHSDGVPSSAAAMMMAVHTGDGSGGSGADVVLKPTNEKRTRRLRGTIHASLNLERVLATKRVTVVVTNVCGFHRLLELVGPVELHSRHAAILALVIDVAVETLGVVDHVLGDHFFLSWNATNHRKFHVTNAARFVAQMQQRLRMDSSAALFQAPVSSQKPSSCALVEQKHDPHSNLNSPSCVPTTNAVMAPLSMGSRYAEDREHPTMNFGLATGSALCGHFGCERLKYPTIIGAVVHHAFALMHQCKAEQLTSLINGDAVTAIMDEIAVLHWNYVMLPQSQKATLISTILGFVSDWASDRISDQDEAGLVSTINRGFEYFASGSLGAVKNTLSRIPEDHWMTVGLRSATAEASVLKTRNGDSNPNNSSSAASNTNNK